MTSWHDIRVCFTALALACRNDAPIDAEWAAFVALVQDSASHPPTHLVMVLSWLAEMHGPKEQITILDHGTGTGVNILYLAALGYTDVWGANVVPKAQPQNRIFRELLGKTEDRIFQYDGIRLPLADSSVDLVLSQQVVEHLPDAVINGYYEDEGRVLKSDGRALHQVPHRWMPYDGHTKTWFAGYLPNPIRFPVWRMMAQNPEQIGSYLFLRERRDHFTRAQQAIGPTSDQSLMRLSVSLSANDYEGPRSIGVLRRGMGQLFRLPILGGAIRSLVRPFSMLETVSIKR